MISVLLSNRIRTRMPKWPIFGHVQLEYVEMAQKENQKGKPIGPFAAKTCDLYLSQPFRAIWETTVCAFNKAINLRIQNAADGQKRAKIYTTVIDEKIF